MYKCDQRQQQPLKQFSYVPCVQRKYLPKWQIAEEEFNDPDKRKMLFWPISDKKKIDGLFTRKHSTKTEATTQEALLAGLSYKLNPRVINILPGDPPARLNSILGKREMGRVTNRDAGTGQLEQNPTVDIGEFTYVLDGSMLSVAPNTTADRAQRFVHPQLKGGWPEVDAAGTITLQKFSGTFIDNWTYHVTNDSGHYAPDSDCIDKVVAFMNTFLAQTQRQPTTHFAKEQQNEHTFAADANYPFWVYKENKDMMCSAPGRILGPRRRPRLTLAEGYRIPQSSTLLT